MLWRVKEGFVVEEVVAREWSCVEDHRGLTLSVILGVRVGIGDVGWVGLQNGFVEWVFVF